MTVIKFICSDLPTLQTIFETDNLFFVFEETLRKKPYNISEL